MFTDKKLQAYKLIKVHPTSPSKLGSILYKWNGRYGFSTKLINAGWSPSNVENWPEYYEDLGIIQIKD